MLSQLKSPSEIIQCSNIFKYDKFFLALPPRGLEIWMCSVLFHEHYKIMYYVTKDYEGFKKC